MSREERDDMVTVFKTDDPAVLPVVQSLFDASGVPHLVQGAEAFHLYPVGVAGPFSRHGLAARVLVPADRADEARQILEELPSDVAVEPASEEE